MVLLIAMASTGRSAPLVFSTAEALRAHVDEAWTNSFSATTLPPGCAFFHDLGVLAYDPGFPSGFFAGCEPILQDGISMHAVEVTETNDVTRVWRCPGAEIGQFPVPAGYNAEAWALQQFPLPPYLDEPARAARLAEAKLGGRQTLRMRLIPQASIAAYLATLAARAANRPAQIGTNDIGAISTRLLPGGQEVEVLVHAPGDVGKIGVYQAPELTAHPDWMFQGFAVRLDNPVAFQVALDAQRRYILFANHQRDTDGDRLPDAYEELITGTRSDLLDSDADGLDDWAEICLHLTSATSADTDGDGRSDALEIELGLNPRQGAPTTDTDWDGDGLREELELQLGSNPHAFDPAPNLNLRHEAKTRTVVLTKFGFRPFQACEDCNPPREQFFLRGIFTETGLTSCPGGDRTNSTATATVTFSPFAEPQVSETVTGVTGSYVWTRPPLSYLDPRLCNPATVRTNDRSDQLWNGEEHYLYTAAPCPEQPSTHTLELSQALDWEYSDLLLESWVKVLQNPAYSPFPSEWNDTNTRTYTGPNPPRVSNVSDLHLSSQTQEVRDPQGCPDYTVVRLDENEHSLASRWVARGAEPENLEVIALRDSKTRVAHDPEEPVAPMLQSLSTVEYHVPADGEGGTAHLVGRRTFRKAGGETIYARDHGMAGTEEPELKSPTKPGQVFVIPDPIQAGPVGGVQTIVKNQYLMLWGNGPSTTAVFQVSLNDSLAGVDWQTVPGTTVGLRVQGPAGGVTASLGGQPLAFGPASGLYVPAEFSLTFTQPGSYTFAATLEGPNVLGETRLVIWQVVVLKIEFISDLDNDYDIDVLDEQAGEAGTQEIIRLNDDDDDDGMEDDLQYMKFSVTPSNVGRVWLGYNPSKIKAWKEKERNTELIVGSPANPTWNLDAGNHVPDHIFIEGVTASSPGEAEHFTVNYTFGTLTLTKDSQFTVSGGVGDTQYFNAIYDYISEYRGPGIPKRYKAFRDKVGAPGQVDSHNLIAMRQRDVRPRIHDARAFNHQWWGEVAAANSSAAVVINGSYFETTSVGIAKGTCISGGNTVSNARPIIANDPINTSGEGGDWFWKHRGWFGLAAEAGIWTAGAPIGGNPVEPPNNQGFNFAVGGSIVCSINRGPFLLPDHACGYNSDASSILGFCNTAEIVFVCSSISGGGHSPAISFHDMIQGFADSEADFIGTLDGGSSVALAAVNRFGESLQLLGTAAARHGSFIRMTAPWQCVSNYLIFDFVQGDAP